MLQKGTVLPGENILKHPYGRQKVLQKRTDRQSKPGPSPFLR
jgi:hypothetical protein